MSWRGQWQTASFRGVEFRFRSASAALGRRNVVHSYPGRDDPYVEDMGRKAREFTIEAFVIGAGYIAWRDKLEAACEQPGPGELVHPTRGRMQVAVQDCRPAENIEAGGLASYSLTFIEAGNNLFPTARVDTQSAVSFAADDALAAVQDDFTGAFTVAGFPAFVNVSALSNATAAIESMRLSALSNLPDMGVLSTFTSGIGGLLGAVDTLLGTPSALASRFLSQIGLLNSLFAPHQARQAAFALSGFGSSLLPVPATTPSRIQQGINQSAVVGLVQRAALIEATRAAGQTTFTSRTEAVAVRDQLANALQTQAETAPDTVYFALTDLRVALVRDVGARAANLADLIGYTPTSTQPAIVLAYRLYGDPSRDAEIVARNRVRHPGFVPGGSELEVLA
ncbi:MAG: hypothetical protein A2Z95_06250 [Gallionellales bacterium GWA2_60_18]|nr:MAG: hypothetical protein A2Z95_06250 [Gallionellales bacterium GWA2_60_18]